MINAYASAIITKTEVEDKQIVTYYLCQLNKKLGHWVFPGGKIEDNEYSEDALIRECEEELDIIPTLFELHGCFLSTIDGNYAWKGEWIGIFYKIKNYKGVIKLMEPTKHLELRWMNIKQLQEACMKDPEMGIAKYLQSIPHI